MFSAVFENSKKVTVLRCWQAQGDGERLAWRDNTASAEETARETHEGICGWVEL